MGKITDNKDNYKDTLSLYLHGMLSKIEFEASLAFYIEENVITRMEHEDHMQKILTCALGVDLDFITDIIEDTGDKDTYEKFVLAEKVVQDVVIPETAAINVDQFPSSYTEISTENIKTCANEQSTLNKNDLNDRITRLHATGIENDALDILQDFLNRFVERKARV